MKYRESEIQTAIVKFGRLYKLPLFAIPNGANVPIRNRKRLVTEGLLRGVPDLFLACPNKEFSGMFIEVKSEKGYLPKEQKEMHKYLESFGYKVIVTRSAIDCVEMIKEYLGNGQD